ncbi:hypothetical protein L249_3735 [Ophiocordyceps polyrhachis-furcata BCC 54312]|uniref:Uncharacterized protein n=1 Tax=Ophiocordyceps polyrhachis-furcata BCC 54312 TaxID=1330021 RepID=A0A367L4V1_9HYPO|nr:hypothetical protein L249_3735 [Ophiocordyceps polyrhachis-furcata BCC 54312]
MNDESKVARPGAGFGRRAGSDVAMYMANGDTKPEPGNAAGQSGTRWLLVVREGTYSGVGGWQQPVAGDGGETVERNFWGTASLSPRQ